MSTIKCNASFCKWNKKGGFCGHPDSVPGIMNGNPEPTDYCQNYRKYSLKSKKLKRK